MLKGRDPVTTPVYGTKGNLPSIVLGASDGGTANSTPIGSLSENIPMTNEYYNSTITSIIDANNNAVTSFTDSNGKVYTAGGAYAVDDSSSALGTVGAGNPTGTGTVTATDANGNVYTIGLSETYSTRVETHASAFLDFSQINAGNINSLLNTGFHTTCCTCYDRYSVKFVDTGDAITQQGENYIYEIDITGITSGNDLIDKIMLAMSGAGTGSGTTTTHPFMDGNGRQFMASMPNNHFTGYAAELDAAGNYTGRLYMFDERSDARPYGESGIFGNGVYQITGYKTGGVKLLNIQTGANGFDGVKMYLPNTELDNLGLVNTIDVSSYNRATNSISAVQKAINKVSEGRAYLGAMQNRFESAIASVDNSAENAQAAESRIRDVDMAAELVEYSKYNILLQAGESVLSQANSHVQGVMKLISQ